MHTGMEMEMDQNMELQRIETMLHQLLDRSGKHETMTALNTQKLDNVDKNVEELKERTKENEETLNSHAKIIDRWKWALGIIGPFALLAASWLARKILPVLFVAVVAHGQTGIKPDQLRATSPEAAKPVLLAFSVRGFTPVALGPGIVATQSATGWTIDIAPSAAPAPRIVRSRLAVTPSADGSYPLTENGVLFRNGLAMTAGVDYTFAAGRATPKTPWPADDLVIADEVTIQ